MPGFEEEFKGNSTEDMYPILDEEAAAKFNKSIQTAEQQIEQSNRGAEKKEMDKSFLDGAREQLGDLYETLKNDPRAGEAVTFLGFAGFVAFMFYHPLVPAGLEQQVHQMELSIPAGEIIKNFDFMDKATHLNTLEVIPMFTSVIIGVLGMALESMEEGNKKVIDEAEDIKRSQMVKDLHDDTI